MAVFHSGNFVCECGSFLILEIHCNDNDVGKEEDKAGAELILCSTTVLNFMIPSINPQLHSEIEKTDV